MPRSHDEVASRYDIAHVAGQFADLLAEVSGKIRPATQMADAPRDAQISGTFGTLRMAIEWAANSFPNGLITAVTPHALVASEVTALLDHPRVASLVVGKGSQPIPAPLAERVGEIDMETGTWVLPKDTGQLIIFLDHPDNFGVRRAVSALKAGIRSVAVPATYLPVWEKYATIRLLVRALYNAARRRIWRVLPFRLFAVSSIRSDRECEQALRRIMAGVPLLPPQAFVPRRVLLVNASLGPGGTERQVANTVVGLRSRGVSDVSLLCERLNPGFHDFYTKLVTSAGVTPTERSRFIVGNLAAGIEPYGHRLSRMVRSLPIDLSIEVILYAAELLARRPAVVHAWQDDTCVKAGLAAAIVGVPHIILSGRSVAPHHFLFHQPYMRWSYRALLERPEVVMVNNSRAGARDYESWLAVPPDSIKVIHNGFDFSAFKRPHPDAVRAYRTRHGIAPGQLVVGTIMRFSEEKRPLLWLDIVRLLAQQRSDLAFLLVGAGVMQAQVDAAAGSLRLGNRLMLVGIEHDAALALAAMDVFVLTSRKEGLPNVLVEAQALGVPVVSTDAGGAAETFEDGLTGRLVTSDDPKALAAAVLAILDDRQWRENAIASAPALVRRRFSVDRMIDETLELYQLAH
jgi:glycosyltransferase involved in cell wall biosynthesis